MFLRAKRKGAVEYCTGKRLTKQLPLREENQISRTGEWHHWVTFIEIWCMFFFPRYLRNGDCTYNGEFDQVYIRRCNSLVLMFWSWFQFLFSYFYLGLRQGHEKLRELEEIMSGQGIFNEDFSLGLGDFLEIPDGDGNGGNGSPGNGGEPPALPNQIPDETKKTNRNLFQPLRVAWKRVSWWAGTRRACCPGRLHSKTFTKNGWSQAHPLGRCLLSMCEYTFWTLLSPMYFFRVAARLCFLTCDISASGTNGMHCQQLLVPWANFFFGTNDFFSWGFFFLFLFFWRAIRWNVKVQVRCLSSTDLFVQRSKNKWRRTQSWRAFTRISLIKSELFCMQFQNESSSVKIHLPKAAPRTRKGKPAKVEPVE